MRLIDYLDKGASLGVDAPCLVKNDVVYSYADVQRLSYKIARALVQSGIKAGDKVAILSANDPVAFSCVFGISRAGAVWCPINPRNEAAENRFILDRFDCNVLIFHSHYAPMVEKIREALPKVHTMICLDDTFLYAQNFDVWLDKVDDSFFQIDPVDDIALIAGTGGTTGRPKGVMLSGQNIETMTAITLMSYPFESRPTYLAFAPLTHAAGVLCFPIMALGGQIVIMSQANLDEFLDLIERHQVSHTFLPPTLIYMLLDHPKLALTNLTSLQCFWYGAAPISTARLNDALIKIGPMAQLFGQTEAPMMISTMSPKDHYLADGSIAFQRLYSAGHPSPLVQVAILSPEGKPLAQNQRGEIVVRSSLVMAGYYKDPQATEDVSQHGWHHTGDIGYLDADNYLYIVDRAKDMIITGGFNVYSIEVEQALQAHTNVQDCAVIGLPDEKWGERIVAVVQARANMSIDTDELMAFVKAKIGSVKTPKHIEVWEDLPRSKVGKVLKAEIKSKILG